MEPIVVGKSNDVILDFAWLCGFLNRKSLRLPRLGAMFLTDSQIHGLIKTGRFFENPLVGRHVLNVRPKKGVNLCIER